MVDTDTLDVSDIDVMALLIEGKSEFEKTLTFAQTTEDLLKAIELASTVGECLQVSPSGLFDDESDEVLQKAMLKAVALSLHSDECVAISNHALNILGLKLDEFTKNTEWGCDLLRKFARFRIEEKRVT